MKPHTDIVFFHKIADIYRSESFGKLYRFGISGAVSAISLFGSLYVLHEILHVWYLLASSVSFLVTVVTSFVLQKFWAFRSKSLTDLPKQFLLFVIFAGINFFVNISCMYFLVDIAKVQYLLAQFITTAIIASWDFLLYFYLIFPKTK